MPILFEKHKGINWQCLCVIWVEGTEDVVLYGEGCVKTWGENGDSGGTTKLYGPSSLESGQEKNYEREVVRGNECPQINEAKNQGNSWEKIDSGSGPSILSGQGFLRRKHFICKVSCIILLSVVWTPWALLFCRMPPETSIRVDCDYFHHKEVLSGDVNQPVGAEKGQLCHLCIPGGSGTLQRCFWSLLLGKAVLWWFCFFKSMWIRYKVSQHGPS